MLIRGYFYKFIPLGQTKINKKPIIVIDDDEDDLELILEAFSELNY